MWTGIRTHRSPLSQDADDKDCLQDVVEDKANQREEKVENVKTDVAVITRQTRGKVAGPAESGVQRNISGADEEHRRRRDKQRQRNGRAIVEELETDEGVQEEDPASRRDCSHMNGGKALVKQSGDRLREQIIRTHLANHWIQRKSAHGEDLA